MREILNSPLWCDVVQIQLEKILSHRIARDGTRIILIIFFFFLMCATYFYFSETRCHLRQNQEIWIEQLHILAIKKHPLHQPILIYFHTENCSRAFVGWNIIMTHELQIEFTINSLLIEYKILHTTKVLFKPIPRFDRFLSFFSHLSNKQFIRLNWLW